MQMTAANIDHFYTFGDVYEAVDACDQLELLLGRLKRQCLLSEQEWLESRHNVAEIRSRLEKQVGSSF